LNDRAVLSPAAAPAVARPATQPLHWRMLAFLSTYLPLVLVALLALGSWWLVQNAAVPGGDDAAAPLRHEPDYQMRTFSVQRFARDGALRAQIEGEELRHYPDTDTVEIDNVRMRSVGIDGRITLASAKRAIANGAGTEVQLLGNAEVVSEAVGDQEPITFRSDFLHAFLDTERVRTHLPVTVVKGAMRVSADGMDYSNLERVVNFRGRTRAVFPPTARNP
jgi:lipopolysaccharide export system protein LptC